MKPVREIPQKGELWRHFKGGIYQILGIATHSETKEILVIYAKQETLFSACARPIGMFMGEVDSEKYPDAKQPYRFEKIRNMAKSQKDDLHSKMERALRFACEATPAPPNEGCKTCIHGALAEDGAKNMGWPSRWQCTLPKERQNDMPMGELHCVPGTVAYFKRKAGIEVESPHVEQ